MFCIVWYDSNVYMYIYIYRLVQRKVFKEAYISFLPVGHTHEDIDQLFSRMAVYLRTSDATCRDEFMAACQWCYTQCLIVKISMPLLIFHK